MSLAPGEAPSLCWLGCRAYREEAVAKPPLEVADVTVEERSTAAPIETPRHGVLVTAAPHGAGYR